MDFDAVAELLRPLSAPDASSGLIAFVHRFDLAFERSFEDTDAPLSETDLRVILARATVGVAPLLEGRSRGAARTGRAARQFALEPTEEHEARLFAAATASYPFGPGEGCHALEALGGHGAPGAGCTSGVGFLAAIASTVGAEAVVRALLETLGPWSRGEPDPLTAA